MKKLMIIIIILFSLIIFTPNSSALADCDAVIHSTFETNLTNDEFQGLQAGTTGDPERDTVEFKLGAASAEFDGTDSIDWLSITEDDNMFNFTIAMWIKLPDPNAGYRPFWRFSSSVCGEIQYAGNAGGASDNLHTQLFDGSGFIRTLIDPTGILDDDWHSLVYIGNRTGDTMTTYSYIDGVQKVQATGGYTCSLANAEPFRYGNDNTQGDGDGLIGNMDDVWIFNRSWTSAEVLEYDNSGSGLLTLDSCFDFAPGEIILVNITSEGGLGQLVNLTDPFCHGGAACILPKTSDITLTLFAKSNENANAAIIDNNRNLNYTDITAGSSECSTTGALVHTCTLAAANATATEGLHNFSISLKDGSNNENNSATLFFTVNITQPIVNLFLDGVADTRKYEFRSKVNLTADCVNIFGKTCEVVIDIPGLNLISFSTGNNLTNVTFNITTLRRINFSHGPTSVVLSSSATLNVSSDNRTKMESVQFNITSAGITNDLNISYGTKMLRFIGDLKTVYLDNNFFNFEGVEVDAANLSYSVKGSQFITINLTDVNNPINITFDLTGFDLDELNAFKYIEHFNGTVGTSGFNELLIIQADAPLWVWEEFANNVSGRWSVTRITGPATALVSSGYATDAHGDYFGMVNIDSSLETVRSKFQLDYVDSPEVTLRNSSRFEIDYLTRLHGTSSGCFTTAEYRTFFTDGTSSVLIDLDTVSVGDETNVYNLTGIKTKSDYTKWDILRNGSSLATVDISSLDDTKQWKLRWDIELNAQGSIGCEGDIDFRLYEIDWGGAALNRSTNNGTYKQFGNITSDVVNVTRTNVSRITLSKIDHLPTNTNINYFVANTCNSSLPTFESVIPGVVHSFDSVGNSICWRGELNSSVNITTPVIKQVTLEVIPATAENISVNGFLVAGVLNSTTSPVDVNITPVANAVNTIIISSGTAGQIQVDNFKMNASVNPVVLDQSEFETCSNCVINFSFSGSALTVNDLKWDFFGSWNYTIVARSGAQRIEKLLQVFYSDFNVTLPKNIDFYDVFARTRDDKNLTPFKQSPTIPIWNVTNLAYDQQVNIYVKTNETIPRLNITYVNSSNQSNSADLNFVLNQSYELILNNLTVNFTGSSRTDKGIWNYIDLYNITNRFVMPWVFFAAHCDECVVDKDDFDNYNIITG